MRGVVVSIQDVGAFGRFKVKGMDEQVGFRQHDVPGGGSTDRRTGDPRGRGGRRLPGCFSGPARPSAGRDTTVPTTADTCDTKRAPRRDTGWRFGGWCQWCVSRSVAAAWGWSTV
jgi:hypothetical protein